MKRLLFPSFLRPFLVVLVAAGFVFGPFLRTDALARPAAKAPVYVTTYQNGASAFQRNFNPFMSTARNDFTQGAIYEPLMIFTTAGVGHVYPWLATHYKWLKGQ